MDGFEYIDDTHTADVLDDTWQIFEAVLAGAANLKAVVFECERNPLDDALLESYGRIDAAMRAA